MIDENRLKENHDLISKYLIKCHTDKDEIFMYCRFLEIVNHIQD